jgi:hypothetical protein
MTTPKACTSCRIALAGNIRHFGGRPYCGYCFEVIASEPDWRWPPECGGDMFQKMKRVQHEGAG